MSVIGAPISGIAQSKEQEKRGLGVPSALTQTPAPVTPATPGDKPELILQTGHTKSANAVAFSPDNRSNMQIEKMKLARNLGLSLSFTETDKRIEGDKLVPDLERRVTQTPRVFYRRES